MLMSRVFYKITAPEILSIPVRDNGEKLVDLLEEYPTISVDLSRSYAQKISPSVSLLRETVADKLVKAQQRLPENITFKVIEGYRPLFVQKIIFEEYKKELAKIHPAWTKEQLFNETSTFVAPPDDVPPHSTGGAIDLTLMDADGKELDMGTRLNELYSEKCFTDSELINEIARAHRQILISVLEAEGFVNYPAEWWHWSYGDRYWAKTTGKSFAIYGTIGV
jgi:zinc D-Ala-D-Ala dipeptidase